ncbi:MAG: transcription antitermination factor NusB [Clostridia bacterium]|nr:transcription antitermination factor NusB [Clostridia bacterium]
MKRKTARENAFILLFEKAIKVDETFEEIFTKATEERSLEVDEYVKKIFFGNAENEKIIDMKIDECLLGWKKERVSFVAKAILKLATYELMFMDDIPVKVSINEAIELSKKFDDDNAYVFVNGVLNKVAESIGRK